MAEVLTQSQIDALLNSIQDDSVKEEKKEVSPTSQKQWKKYDFYSPKKFTKDKMKLIKGIYDNFARLASSRLNGVLRTACEMEVISVEEQRYYEFANSLSDNDVITLQGLNLPDESKNPPLICHISQKLMVNMIDRMLGGTGMEDAVDTSYLYTDIEIVLYKKVMHYFLGVTKDAWGNYIKIDLDTPELEVNPSLFQEISLDEPVAIILIEVHMQGVEGKITVCIPGNLLMSIFSVIDKRKHVDSLYDEHIESNRNLIMTKLNKTSLEIKAELGAAKLSLNDVCGLQVGDVIDLNKRKDSNIVLYVEEQPWFEGKLGAHESNAAVKIRKRLQEEKAPVE